jgi:hypothetical protein
MLLFLGFALPAGAMDDGQVQKVVEGIAQRRDAMLRRMVDHPYPPSGLWRDEDFALAAYWLGQRVPEADRAIVHEFRQEFPAAMKEAENSFHWHAYLLERIYFLFGPTGQRAAGRMGAEAQHALLEMLWQWAGPNCRREMTLPERDFWYWGSENHHAQAWSSFWGAAEIFARHPDYQRRRYADGTTPADMARAFTEYFIRYARHRAATGLLVECNSDYNKYTLGGWYNMADFASDPRLRRQMTRLLDLYWADWAIEQLDGVRGGSRHRCYPGAGSTEGSSGQGAAWYHFGLGLPLSQHPSVMCAATSGYRPLPCVAELALRPAARGVYEFVSRRPGLAQPGTTRNAAVNFVADPAHRFHVKQGVYALNPDGGSLLRYTWCTPDFVMGTSMVEPRPQADWTAISSQNRWEGVIFGGDRRARIFVQPLQPPRGSVYNAEWSVEKKGVLIVQRLKTSNAHGQRIWFDSSLRRSERGGWVFAEAPRAYAAVRVVEGATAWEPDTIAQHREGKGPTDLGLWLACRDEFSPVILELARNCDWPTFAAFQASVLDNPLAWRGKRLEYESRGYGVRLVLPENYTSEPLVDGKPVDCRPAKVFDSPALQSDFGSAIVTIRAGSRSAVLDFNEK